jgi:hypothetical protein
MTDDPRIVYGVRCSWWDSISKVGKTPPHKGISLPCCPHCGGVLFEISDELLWWALVSRTGKERSDPDYVEFMKWLRGRCFVDGLRTAREVFEKGRKKP